MSANYCEARHKETGIPETHCFHATGKMKRLGGFKKPARPVEKCCWCDELTLGAPIVVKHGPLLPKAK